MIEVHPLDAQGSGRVVALELVAGEASVEEIAIDLESAESSEP